MSPNSSSGEHRRAPVQIGKYTLLMRLASGGMGEVHVARMTAAAGFEKQVVIKRLLPELARDEQYVQMFLSEARLTARLSHPNICQVFELAEIEGEYYLVMEYLEGLPLSRLFQEYLDRGLDLRIATGLITQACEGLEYAHGFRDPDRQVEGIVHRDVSPHNLMLTTTGVVKLLDFGVAKLRRQGSQTVTGSAKGKYAYMSPEQLHCDPLDARSDVFALGVVLFEMLSGTRLFRRKSELATMQAIVDGDHPRLRDVKRGVPRKLSQVVDRALQVDRDKRHGSARELAEDIRAAMASAGGPASLSELAQYIQQRHGDVLQEQRALIRQAADRTDAGEGPGSDVTIVDGKRFLLALPAPTVTGSSSSGSFPEPADPGPLMSAAEAARWSTGVTLDVSEAPAGPSTEVSTATSAAGLVASRSPGKERSGARWLWPALAVVAVLGALLIWRQTASAPDEATASASGNAAVLVAPAAPTGTPPPPSADEEPRAASPDVDKDVTPTPTPLTSKPTTARAARAKRPSVKRKQKSRTRSAKARPVTGHGYLTIDASPYATIYVDGKKIGVTPLVRVKLSAGSHAVRAVSSAGGSKRLKVHIDKDKTSKRRVVF